jgi:hypothetical protein
MRLACVVLLFCAATAYAEKPTVAVLGVIPKDASLVKSTRAFDDALRTVANAKASPYRVKGTTRQVADAIRTAECSVIEPTCAVKLGAALGADFAIAGELEKRGEHVELKMIVVDVAKKQKVRSLRDVVGGSSDMRKLALKSFDKLTGVEEMGELAIVASAKRGEIYVNDELFAALFDGRATLQLPVGRYRIAIAAPGKRRYEENVVVSGRTQLNVLLD